MGHRIIFVFVFKDGQELNIRLILCNWKDEGTTEENRISLQRKMKSKCVVKEEKSLDRRRVGNMPPLL